MEKSGISGRFLTFGPVWWVTMNSACGRQDSFSFRGPFRITGNHKSQTVHQLRLFNSKGATIKQMLVFLGFSIVPCQNVTPCVVGGVVTFLVYKELVERWKQTIAPLKDWGILLD